MPQKPKRRPSSLHQKEKRSSDNILAKKARKSLNDHRSLSNNNATLHDQSSDSRDAPILNRNTRNTTSAAIEARSIARTRNENRSVIPPSRGSSPADIGKGQRQVEISTRNTSLTERSASSHCDSEDDGTLSDRLISSTGRKDSSACPTENDAALDDVAVVHRSRTPARLSERRNRRVQKDTVPREPTVITSRLIPEQRGILDNSDNLESLGNTATLLPAFNQVKTQLLETQRDKQVYAATVISQADKIESLKRELSQKTQQILSLETSMNKKGKSNAKRGNIWSQENLNVAGIAEYQGICLAVGRLGSSESALLVTESYIDTKHEKCRRRDWRSSAVAVSEETSKVAFQFVKLPTGVPAIPTCIMARALEAKFYSNPYKTPTGFLRKCLRIVLSSPAASFMTEDEKNICEARIASHRPSIQKFRAIISDSVGNRKKIARNTYLRSLGYYNAVRPSSKKDSYTVKEMRENEKNLVASRCNSLLESGLTCTTFWRTGDWKVLCFKISDGSVATEMEQGEERLANNNEVDCWFLNEASRRAFIELRGYTSPDFHDEFVKDVSILTLARADAAMTTMLKMITVGGKGGVRNNGFIESFRTLLPTALELIIKELWMDISERAEHELRPFIGNSKENECDPFGNNLRDYTVVQVNPDDNYVYVLASAKYLRENVCSWFGNVKDAHLGRCKKEEEEFIMIDKNMKFDEDENSDIDDLSCEEIPQTEIDGGETPDGSQTRQVD